MLPGTKKLFPTTYETFKEAMISAAKDEELPAALSLDDVGDYTLKDVQDMFYEFHKETMLNISGSLFLCEDCGRMHLMIEVDYPEQEENQLIQ